MARTAALILFIIVSAHSTWGQDPTPESELNIFTKIVSPSPDAAKLASYVESPVSHFAGQPIVEIPIYEFKGKELSLPVKLSYKTGGITVEEISSGVGLGWSLIAGGVITRTVFGLPDEGNIGSSTMPFFDNYTRLLANKDGLPNLANSSCGAPNTISTYRDFQNDVLKYKTADTQPDIFFYKVDGHMGKMFLDETGTPRTIPFKNYKITPGVGPLASAYWTIITDNGDKYIFSAVEETRTDAMTPGIDEFDKDKNFISSWYLTQIISRNGFDVYTFEYNQTAEIQEKTNSGFNEFRRDMMGTYEPLCASQEVPPTFSPGPLIYLRQLFLSRISDNHGRVVEITNIQDRQDYVGAFRHSMIEVKDRQETIRSVTFYNNQYFGSGGETTKRLKLDRIEITGSDSSEPEVFRFQYNALNLPDRFAYAQDLWGYYNGSGGNTMIPAMEGLPGGVARNPNEYYTKACNLEMVYYPTGGYEHFVYELHSAGSTQVGGLRIKEINWHDDNTSLVKKTVYRYVGQQISSPLNSITETYVRLNCGTENPNPSSCYYVTRFAANRSQVGASAGIHIGYTQVEEEVRDILDVSGNGKTVYRFHAPSISTAYPFNPPAFQDAIPLGRLFSKKIYDSNNTLLRSEEYCYQGIGADNPDTEQRIPSSGIGPVVKKSMIALQLASDLTSYSRPLQSKVVGCTIVYGHPCNLFQDGFAPIVGFIPLKTYQFGYTSSFAYYPLGKVIRTYSNGQEFVEVEKLTYSPNTIYNYVVAQEVSTSTSATVLTQLTYPFQLTGEPYASMITKNMLTQLIEKKRFRNDGSSTPIHGEKYSFQEINGDILPVTYSVAADGVNYDDEIQGIIYDNNGNVIRYSEKGIVRSCIWEGLDLLAEAWGAEAISYEGFEGKTSTTDNPKAGSNYSAIQYQVSLLPNTSICGLSYWTRNSSGVWELTVTTITATTNIGGSGVPIDEVRVFPLGAHMTTYSYLKDQRVSTTMDSNHKARHYRYDSKGRLTMEIDDDGKILKKYEYHYRTGPVPSPN